MEFAENLQKTYNITQSREVTQKQLADVLSVSRQYVSKWES